MKALGLWTALLLALALFQPAHAQLIYGQQVTTCGTPPNTPVSGGVYPVNIANGQLCTSGSGGGGSSSAGGGIGANPITPAGPTVALTAGTTTSNAAIGTVAPTVQIANASTTTGAWVNLGGSGVTATMGAVYLPPGSIEQFTVGANTYVAAITASGTAQLYITPGTTLLDNVSAAALSTTAQAVTSGPGNSVSHLVTTASTNASVPASGAHTLKGVMFVNTTTSLACVHFYNTASTPTPGTTTVVETVPVGANATLGNASGAFAPVGGLEGVAFSTGIAVSVTGGASGLCTDADTSSAPAGVVVDFAYR